MLTNCILLLTLLAYSIIVSQSFMYILALKQVQLKLDAGPYTELRKLIDNSMRRNFKYVVYAALLLSPALVLVTCKTPGSLLFVMAIVAFLALVVDTLLTVKGNLPINDIINTWSPDVYPSEWSNYRAKWLTIYQYRQCANITGFICLLVAVVFR